MKSKFWWWSYSVLFFCNDWIWNQNSEGSGGCMKRVARGVFTFDLFPVLWSHQVGHEQRDHVFVISYGHVFMISSWTGSRRNVHFRMLITKWWSGHDLLMNWITDHQLYTVSWWSVREQVREQVHELVHEQITSKITNMITNGSPARSRNWSRIDHQQDHDLDHEHYHERGHPGRWTFLVNT